MTAKRTLQNVGIPALALSCLILALSGENPAPAGGADGRGKPVLREETDSDMPDLSTIACWTGTARSADLEVEVPAAGAAR